MLARSLLVALPLFFAAVAGCNGEGDVSASPKPDTDACKGVVKTSLTLANSNHTVVGLSTTEGCIVAELYDEKSPITVANFKTYVNEGFYEDLLFHRIMKGFMIQTGGMEENGQFKEGTHPAIKNEAKTSLLKNLRHTLSMARTNAADSATNQFFINAVDNCFLDPKTNSACPTQAGPDGYAVFGIVVSGRDVVAKIEATPVHACPSSGEASCPDHNVFFRSAKVIA